MRRRPPCRVPGPRQMPAFTGRPGAAKGRRGEKSGAVKRPPQHFYYTIPLRQSQRLRRRGPGFLPSAQEGPEILMRYPILQNRARRGIIKIQKRSESHVLGSFPQTKKARLTTDGTHLLSEITLDCYRDPEQKSRVISCVPSGQGAAAWLTGRIPAASRCFFMPGSRSPYFLANRFMKKSVNAASSASWDT